MATVVLDEVLYHRFVRMVQAADLATLKANQMVQTAASQRDALYRQIAADHDLPEQPQTITWNDETLEIEIA